MEYMVFLNGEKIGDTRLEYGDPPMGVVFGALVSDLVNYQFLKGYCTNHKIAVHYEDAEVELIGTGNIPRLLVMSVKGVEIEAQVQSISGSSLDGFQITLEGIGSELYHQLFIHHLLEYERRFPSL